MQKFKVLTVSNVQDFDPDVIKTELYSKTKYHYEIVVVFGSVPRWLPILLSDAFQTALILFCTQEPVCCEDGSGIVNGSKGRMFYFDHLRSVFCIGKVTQAENLPPCSVLCCAEPPAFFNENSVQEMENEMRRLQIRQDIYECGPDEFTEQDILRLHELPQPEDPDGNPEINRYALQSRPSYILHGGRKNQNSSILPPYTRLVSCYGVQEHVLSLRANPLRLQKCFASEQDAD